MRSDTVAFYHYLRFKGDTTSTSVNWAEFWRPLQKQVKVE